MSFDKLSQYVDSLPAAGVPGCDLIVYRDHEVVFRRQAGFRDDAKTKPMQGDETYSLYSCSKVFTTCAVMQLIEAGKIALDDPVAKFLPAFSSMKVKDGDGTKPAERVMTIRHLMSMQGGLDYNMDTEAIRETLKRTDNRATTRELIDAKAQDALQFEPGTDFLYSLCHDVLGAVIEVVSGQSFSQYLKEHIFMPLGLDTIGFRLKEEDMAKECAQYQFHPEEKRYELCPPMQNHYRLSPNYESGGAGLASNVRDCALFADALACGGKGADGARILSPEMIQLWSANQLGPRSRASFDAWNRLGYSYALGVRTRVTLEKGIRGGIGEFGWDGAAGAWMMIDPHKHVSAFYAMHVRNFGDSYYVIHPNIRALIYEALDI